MGWASATRKAPKAPEPAFFLPTFPIEKVDWAQLVALDFETYYDDQYTLSKLSTSEYVRDPRFEATMVGLKIGRKPRRVIPGPRIKAELAKIDWKTHSVLCHNVPFDGFILSDRYKIVPKRYYCTLSMARGLHSNEIGAGLDEVAQFYGRAGKIAGGIEAMKGKRYKDLVREGLYERGAEYCGNDVDEMLGIFEQMIVKMPADEVELIDLICRMFCDPVLKVDIPRVEAELKRELIVRRELFTTLIDATKFESVLKGKEKLLTGDDRIELITKRVVGSNERFADLLRAEGITPPRKISPAWMKKPRDERTDEEKYTYAFAKTDLEFVGLPEDEAQLGAGLDLSKTRDAFKFAARQARVRKLVDARLMVKSTSNVMRAQRFLVAGANGMPLPMGYGYYRAHTGRIGGSNRMNMQNLARGGELRKSILAPRGHHICVADSGQIEARVNAWLWDEYDLLDAFRAADLKLGADPYCRFASVVYGHEITKADTAERFLGKVCLSGDTKVLTNHGVKPMIAVRSTDMLWDGVEWVSHDGLIFQGVKPVLRARGMTATPDHEVLVANGQWREWSAVLTNPSLFQSALSSAASPSCAGITTQRRKESSGATDLLSVARAALNTWSTPTTFVADVRRAATLVRKWLRAQNGTGSTSTRWMTTDTVEDFSTGSRPRSHDAQIRTMPCISTTAYEELVSMSDGVLIALSFFGTFKRWMGGTRQFLKWIASTPTKATFPATFASSLSSKTSATSAESKILSSASAISNERIATYDLANAGPRHRFTVITDDGPVIVHNCILALGYGMSASKLLLTLARGALGGAPVYLTDAECIRIVNLYRRTNRKIAKGWTFCGGIIEDMAAGRQGSYKCLSWDKEVIYLPNGMTLKYPDLKKSTNEDGFVEWTYRSGDIRKKIYGAMLCENIVQALARIIVFSQMLVINRKRRVVLTTHDEVGALAKVGESKKFLGFMIETMRTPLTWCADIPLNAEGIAEPYYAK